MKLTVTIRDDTPMRLFGDPPKYRTVTIRLDDVAILKALTLKHLGKFMGENVWEEVADYVLEDEGFPVCEPVPLSERAMKSRQGPGPGRGEGTHADS